MTCFRVNEIPMDWTIQRPLWWILSNWMLKIYESTIGTAKALTLDQDTTTLSDELELAKIAGTNLMTAKSDEFMTKQQTRKLR